MLLGAIFGPSGNGLRGGPLGLRNKRQACQSAFLKFGGIVNTIDHQCAYRLAKLRLFVRIPSSHH